MIPSSSLPCLEVTRAACGLAKRNAENLALIGVRTGGSDHCPAVQHPGAWPGTTATRMTGPEGTRLTLPRSPAFQRTQGSLSTRSAVAVAAPPNKAKRPPRVAFLLC